MSLTEAKAMVEGLSEQDRLELLAWMEQQTQCESDAITFSMSKDELNAAIRVGLDQLQRGESISGDEAHERLRKRSIAHSQPGA
jgi:hypothetical protein